ncbi:hypothetical protein [Paractinoplanes toevensis]|uniref:Knr4/Smi1-like domain-containing protein n=1 Tax=Paractinoplanes toevensis TaxID=571911 RepID=A0A919TH91_9ACTN|nr:hypothetical protein [Actinoplanes toevensis]GIM94064.1 hypothetical protein Ato02nite_058570 [Actinoplanes toevensis]
MSGITDWKTDVRAELERLGTGFEERFGYPFGADENYVDEPEAGGNDIPLPPALAAFYAEVGAVSLADVHNGYFIHPATQIPMSAEWGRPVRAEVDDIGDVVTFGTDGSGGFFSLAPSDGSVYHLPAGELVAGIYRGGLGDPVKVAKDFPEFLDRLLGVVREFTADGHTSGL